VICFCFFKAQFFVDKIFSIANFGAKVWAIRWRLNFLSDLYFLLVRHVVRAFGAMQRIKVKNRFLSAGADDVMESFYKFIKERNSFHNLLASVTSYLFLQLSF
jgi:hypothetical protein